MIPSRKQEYSLMTVQEVDAAPASAYAEPSIAQYYFAPKRREINVIKELEDFYSSACTITEMVWTCNYYGIAVFEPGYFGKTNGYVGSGGGSGGGGGGGYKVVSSGPAATSSGGMG